MPSPRRSRLTFETFQHFICNAKILLVEIAGLIGLVVLLYHGLRIEIRW